MLVTIHLSTVFLVPCPVIGDAAVAPLRSAVAAAAAAAAAAVAGSSSFSTFSSVLLHGGTSAMPSTGSRSRAYQNILDDPPFDSPFSTGETA